MSKRHRTHKQPRQQSAEEALCTAYNSLLATYYTLETKKKVCQRAEVSMCRTTASTNTLCVGWKTANCVSIRPNPTQKPVPRLGSNRFAQATQRWKLPEISTAIRTRTEIQAIAVWLYHYRAHKFHASAINPGPHAFCVRNERMCSTWILAEHGTTW